MIRTASDTAHTATTGRTCLPRSPCRSTKAFWLPIATISESPSANPDKAVSRWFASLLA